MTDETKQRGLSAQEYAPRILENSLGPRDRRVEGLRALLSSWIEERNAEEQRERGEYLARVLDEDRSSARRLFPPESKGVSW
jgi:hypothetical protein